MKRIFFILCCCGGPKAFGVEIESKSTHAKDFLLTAGYGGIFGAFSGALLSSSTPSVKEKLETVQVGATLGLIAGSILGAHVIFSPNLSAGAKTAPEVKIFPLVAYNAGRGAIGVGLSLSE